MKKFLEKIQLAEDGKKKRWMILVTLVAMMVVVYIWLAYFNNLLADLSRPATVEEVKVQSKGGFSFLETMKSGVGTVFESLKGIFYHRKEYIIKPSP
ncbi:MAG: hypothetical protein HY093_02810 [Candidatus Liptonbacteria bacterium]|nr:hypothetical protein [Candidatus Liptonbacteria bacterium]